MNVLIIGTNRHARPVPVVPLGACIAAEAAEKAGHRVKMLDLMFEKSPLSAAEQAIDTLRPDVIGLSVRNIDNNDIRQPLFFPVQLPPLINAIRRKTGAPIVLGGAATSVMPEALLRYTGADCSVTGDADRAFPELLGRLSSGEAYDDLPGISFMDGPTFRHNPPSARSTSGGSFPDLTKWIKIADYRSRLASAPLQSKLGCQFRCTYCTYRKIEGETYRIFDPGSVADSVQRLAACGFHQIEFVDNVFNAPYGHAIALCERLARSGKTIPLYSLELNPLFVDDTLLDTMAKAGFAGIGITVESASDRVLKGLGKAYSSKEVYRSAEVVARHKLPCVWIFMLGGPGETRSTIEETLRFASRHIRDSDTAFFNMGIRIYPGTELETIAREQGALSLPGSSMLEPVFYISPEIAPSPADALSWMERRLGTSMQRNMNFMDSGSLALSFLPAIHRLAYRLGMRSPLWKYTRYIRRGLRSLGVQA